MSDPRRSSITVERPVNAPPVAARTAETMTVERMLQINIALLVVLGTTLLAMGQQSLLYAAAAVIVAVSSVILCDMRGIVRLGPDATTFAAVLSCCVLVVQVIRNVEQSHLLNVANVLIYLEGILLFQRKEDRSYWSLMALSFLQVIVAAALNLGLLFGVMLVLYVVAAFSALMLFYLVRETRPYLSRWAESTAGPVTAPWPLAAVGSGGSAAEPLQVASLPLSPDAPREVISRSLLLRLTRMVLVMAGGTIVAFFALPRFSNTSWQSPDQDQVATVGFTEEVRLDDISRILESPEQVMRVEFANLRGSPYQVDGEPYFRGTVLSYYDFDRRVWKQDRWHQNKNNRRPFRRNPNVDLSSIVVQHITLQPGSHSALFHVAPSYFVDGTPDNLEVNAITGQLSLNDDDDVSPQDTFRYTLGTTAFRNGWQRDILPGFAPSFNFDNVNVRESFPQLTALADQIIDDQGLREASAFDRAKALENYFRRSGLYKYSLEASKQRNHDVDPLEDFVSNHRTGHCEYFAGALVMMLRSQGIRAHMVVGYKGGDFNTVGNYYIVRQLHAHAWVEAILESEQIPEDERESLDDRPLAWLVLDPTPSSSDIDLNDRRLAVIRRAREFADYCQVLWDDYVLGLNAARQEQAIYGPVRRGLQSAGRWLFSPDVWRSRWLAVKRWFALVRGAPQVSLPLIGGSLAGIVGVLGWGYRRWRRGMMTSIWKRRGKLALEGVRWPIYDRLQDLFRPLGLERQPHQTAAEFARIVQRHLAAVPQAALWGPLPLEIVEAYQRLRYGQQPPSGDDEQRWERDLAALKEALPPPLRRAKPRPST